MEKKIKKSTISIVCVICLFCSIFLMSGCAAPRGFHRRGEPPLIYVGEGKGVPVNVVTQFPELEGYAFFQGQHKRREFFIFEGNIHFVEFGLGGSFFSATIFMQIDSENSEKIGTFIDLERGQTQGTASFTWPFIHHNFLFYQVTRTINRWAGFIDRREIFVRHEFFRFCLIAGTNEEIRLTLFAETIQNYNSNWVTNPKYKGER